MEMLKSLRVLSDDEVYRIHMNIMEVLWQIGIRVEEKQSLQLLEKNGAIVDYNSHRAYLPPELIQHCLSVKAHSFCFYDVNGKKIIDVGGNKTYYATSGFSTTYVDKDMVSREGTCAALEKEAEYTEVMDEISMVQASIQPCDVHPALQEMHMVKNLLVGTKKPIRSCATTEKTAEAITYMLAEMVGGLDVLYKKPLFLYNVCTFCPLTIRKDACEVIRSAAKYNIPCEFSTGPMAGATSPVTLAATTVQSFAEVIGHIVLAQCYKPGLPVTVSHAARAFDMKYCACTVATPEFPILKVAAIQMAHFYRIPVTVLGTIADSNEYDVQMGWEKFMTTFIARQAGVNMESGAGMYSQLNQFSYIALALDGELIRNVERIGRGMEVNDFSLAFDVMKEAVDNGGDFMSHDHTLFHWQEEFQVPILSERMTIANWTKKKGQNNLIDRAREQLEQYESEYHYTYGREKEEDLQKIIDEYTDAVMKEER